MISREETIFVHDFLDALKNSGVDKFPFGNNAYERGVAAVKETLEHNFPEEYEGLQLLFAKRSISGDYARMEVALKQNMGSRIGTMEPWDGHLHLIKPRSSIGRPSELSKNLADIFTTSYSTLK